MDADPIVGEVAVGTSAFRKKLACPKNGLYFQALA